MVSLTALLTIALLAVSALASPSATPACKELHPKDGTVKLAQPYFTPGKSNAVIDKRWKSDDGTRVLIKNTFQNNDSILLIKTKNRKVHRIELGFRVNGDQTEKRHFKLKKNHTCYVPANNNNDVNGINMVSYYHRVKN